MHHRPQVSAETSMATAHDLLLRGLLDQGLAIIEPASEMGDDIAAFMLVQVLAFKDEWVRVRNLCVRLLKQPFALDPLSNQDVMKLFILSAIKISDWKEAIKRIEAVRVHLESMLDMSTELNSFAEAFNRFEAYILSEGKGKLPFRTISPVNCASMTKDEYARLSSLPLRTEKEPNLTLTFDQLDKNKQHSFHLWKALYDQDLQKALTLYEVGAEAFYTSLGQTMELAHLLTADKQDDRAWQILKPVLLAETPEYGYDVVWLELLWDEKTRPLMTSQRRCQLLTSDRSRHDRGDIPLTEVTKQRARLDYICSLAACLTDQAVEAMEERVMDECDNLELRLKLIGAYSNYDAQSLARKKPHVLWLIEKYPDSPMIEDLLRYLYLDRMTIAKDFEEFKQKWLESIEQNPSNAKLLFNASLLLGVDDKALAHELLSRAQTIEPESIKFAERLYELNAFQVSETSGRQRLVHARAALKQVDIMEALSSSSLPPPFSQLTIVSRRAWFTLEAGEQKICQKLICKMLSLAQTEGLEQTYQLLSKVIEGRLALTEGETEKAIQCMMSTLPLEPFSHFRQDNPLLTLLAELSADGQSASVLEFFALYQKRYEQDDRQHLRRFFADIAEGSTPWVPAVRL